MTRDLTEAAGADAGAVARAQDDDGRSTSELVTAYREGPRLLRRMLTGMSDEDLHARPVPGKMSALEVIGHVADSELYLSDRMKRTVAMEVPLLVGVDGWLYLDALNYQARGLELQLRLIDTVREHTAADLARLPEDAWARTAVHTETGLVTLRQLLLHAVRHLEWHAGAIAEKRVALGLD